MTDSFEGRSDKKLTAIILYLVAYALLSIIYVSYVFPVWEYIGFSLNIDNIKIFISVIIIIVFVMLTPKKLDVRGYLLNLSLTISLLPSLVLYAFAGMPTSSALVIWIALTTVYVISAIPFPRITAAQVSPKNLLWIVLFLLTGVVFAFFATGGLSNFNLDIRRVYEFRDDAAQNLPSLFAYLAPISTKIIIPFGIVVSIFHKKYIWSILILSYTILIFGFTSHKSIIVYPIVSCIVYYTILYRPRYSTVLASFVFFLLVACVDVAVFSSIGPGVYQGLFVSLFVRRALMVPALLDYYYIEFFTEHPWYLWATSRLSFGLIDNPYGMATAPFVIGEAYFHSMESSANTGYIGSGFSQAGLAGTLIYAVGVGFVISMLQAYGRYLGLPLVASIITSQALIMFTTTDFVVLLLTHGLLVSFLLLSMTAAPTLSGRQQVVPPARPAE